MDTVVLDDLILIRSTELAYLVTDGTDDTWIPKSQVSRITFGEDINVDGDPAKKIIEMEIPRWLAEDKNLA